MNKLRVEYYLDRRGEHRWRIKAANNRILADSGEGYANRADAEEAAAKVMGEDQPAE